MNSINLNPLDGDTMDPTDPTSMMYNPTLASNKMGITPQDELILAASLISQSSDVSQPSNSVSQVANQNAINQNIINQNIVDGDSRTGRRNLRNLENKI